MRASAVGLSAERKLITLHETLVSGRSLERGDVPVGHDHQVAVVIGIQVEDNVAETAPDEHEIVGVRVVAITENAAGRRAARAGHIGETPRRPKTLHSRWS